MAGQPGAADPAVDHNSEASMTPAYFANLSIIRFSSEVKSV